MILQGLYYIKICMRIYVQHVVCVNLLVWHIIGTWFCVWVAFGGIGWQNVRNEKHPRMQRICCVFEGVLYLRLAGIEPATYRLGGGCSIP